MSVAQLSQVLRHLRRAVATQDRAVPSEAELWQRYVLHRDESAFEMLVRRHGPMVLGVCRRVLRNEQDAEDAFQATFLVLVRRASSLRSPQTIANWLHGVARRTALEARSAAARRRAKEAAVVPRIQSACNPRVDSSDDVVPALEQELGRLAEKYRTAVVICDLEGKTRKEAARQLGWAEGTVASRLARGRGILARRLSGRGFTGALVASTLACRATRASLPTSLVNSTVSAAGFFGARTAVTGGTPSCTVAALTEGVLKSMLLSKLKNAIAVLLVAGIAVLSGGALISRSLATEPAEQGAAQQQQPPNQDHLHDRVVELKQQLQQMEKKIAKLEQETQPRRNARKPDVSFLADRFKYRIPFEIGRTYTNEGGGIEIREVWGTRPQIEVGGQYLVRGKYALPAGTRGILHFYASAGGAWGAITTALDLQSMAMDKQEGEFALVHGMSGPGNFHLILTAADRYSRCFADVYFGTGDNVLKDKE